MTRAPSLDTLRKKRWGKLTLGGVGEGVLVCLYLQVVEKLRCEVSECFEKKKKLEKKK